MSLFFSLAIFVVSAQFPELFATSFIVNREAIWFQDKTLLNFPFSVENGWPKFFGLHEMPMIEFWVQKHFFHHS